MFNCALEARLSNVIRRPYSGFYFSPKVKAYHLVVKMKDVPGALSIVLAMLPDVVDLVDSVSYTLEDWTAVWSGFGKSLSEKETEASIKELIERSPLVLDCQVKESENGVVVDSFHAGLEVAPDRPAMVLPVAGFSRICDHLARILGSGGETILYEEGAALGRLTGRFLNDKLGDGKLELRFMAALGMYRASGWGTLSVQAERSGSQFRVVAKDCPECADAGRDRTECGFLRGHLTSMISMLGREEFKSEETKCRLRGDSTCEFILTRQEGGVAARAPGRRKLR